MSWVRDPLGPPEILPPNIVGAFYYNWVVVGYLKETTHISWVITGISFGIIVGVAGVKALNCELLASMSDKWLMGAGIVLAALAVFSCLRLLMPVAIVAGLLIGYARGAAVNNDLAVYDQYIGDDVVIVGRLDGDPSYDQDLIAGSLAQIYLVKLGGSNATKMELPGRIWFSADDGRANLNRYDWLVIAGTLDMGFGSYVASIQRGDLVGVWTTDADIAGKLRNEFLNNLAKVMDEQQAGLGMGLLAGQKTALDDDIQDAFVTASLTHILVASGYNLTVLVRFARRLLARRSRLLALGLSIILIILFVQVTGSSASMDRAALVSTLSLLFWYVGRGSHPVVILSFVAAVTILIDPSQLWGDVGWYLSFASFAGVIILAPLLNDVVKAIWHRCVGNNEDDALEANDIDRKELTIVAKLARRVEGWPASLGQIIIETVSAQIMTVPLIALFMGQISLAGFITNIPVLPLLPLAMLLTFITGLAVCVLPLSLATVVGRPAQWLLGFIINMAIWGQTLPGSSVEWQPDWSTVIAYYGVVIVMIVILKRLTHHNFYSDNVVE